MSHWCNGSITAFQADGEGSSPLCDSNNRDNLLDLMKTGLDKPISLCSGCLFTYLMNKAKFIPDWCIQEELFTLYTKNAFVVQLAERMISNH